MNYGAVDVELSLQSHRAAVELSIFLLLLAFIFLSKQRVPKITDVHFVWCGLVAKKKRDCDVFFFFGSAMVFDCVSGSGSFWQLSFRGVRASKFRHVFGQVARKDRCYENVKITKDAHDANCCAVNPKFLAIITEVRAPGSRRAAEPRKRSNQ